MFSIETANIFFKDFLGDSDRLERERERERKKKKSLINNAGFLKKKNNKSQLGRAKLYQFNVSTRK